MTVVFGDAEPEDAWHPEDTVDELLDNLSRRCTVLGEPRRIRDHASQQDWLDDLRQRLARLRRRNLAGRDLVRVNLIAEDIEFVQYRIDEAT